MRPKTRGEVDRVGTWQDIREQQLVTGMVMASATQEEREAAAALRMEREMGVEAAAQLVEGRRLAAVGV